MRALSSAVALGLALLASGSAQAFCFLKDNNRDRQFNYNQYRVPASAFMQRQVNYYPNSRVAPPVWYDQGIPAIMPEPVDVDRYEGK